MRDTCRIGREPLVTAQLCQSQHLQQPQELAVITDRDALQAVATAFKHLKIIIEPGGAAALAAVLTGQYPAGAKTVVAVASGGNIDAPMFQRALDEGPLF